MTRAITEADWTAPLKALPVSRQKKDALFELACRVALIAERARTSETASIADDARIERRKVLRFGLELLAQGADQETIELAYGHSASTSDLDAGTRLELATLGAGLSAIAAGRHPFIALRRMTAFLGYDYFEKASEWIAAKLRKRRSKGLTLLVPGDFPDLIRNLSLDPRSLERALRGAGWELAVAALAGCAQESIDLVAGFYGPAGGTIFSDDAAWMRGKLSGDEISQAQGEFMTVVKRLESEGELAIGREDAFASDPDFIHELTRAVMSLDDRSLRSVFKDGDSRILALAMQGLEPRAHERILGLLPSRVARRLLDAVDDAAILPRREVLVAGKTLAQAVLAQAALTKSSPRESLESFGKVRDWSEGSTAEKG
ncbi:MAG: FliG C-terminal domain-containing protein [Rectinemataceae bacterium]